MTLMTLLNHPVTLDSSKDSPSIPFWAAVLAFILPVLGAVAIFAASFSTLFGAAAPFFMLVAAGIIFAFLYTWRNEAQRKFFKLPFDLSWNIWTFLSVAYLFYGVLEHGSDLKAFLDSLDPVLLTVMFSWACSTAVARAAISLSDVCTLRRKPK